jgi:plastocyanin
LAGTFPVIQENAMRSSLFRHIALGGLLVGSLAACSGTTASPGTTSTLGTPDASAGSPVTGSESVTVTGVEYAYEGIPGNVTAGTTITFVNSGQEVHEIVAVRRNEGVTTTLDELLAAPEDELEQFVTFLGVAIADPGETAPETITLDQPGGYIFLCFIPVGTTALPSTAPGESPSASLPAGPPHVVQGMVAEFTVTE